MHVDDDELRRIEDMIVTVDRLDNEAFQGDEPYANVELDAVLVAKRNRLLIELDVASVFDGGQRDRLISLGLDGMVSYCDAALQLERYLRSSGFARLVKHPPPAKLLEAYVSLDWFRKPSGYIAPGVEPNDWLALCEANVRAAPRLHTGTMFVKLERKFHRLFIRMELNRPKLYRAVPA